MTIKVSFVKKVVGIFFFIIGIYEYKSRNNKSSFDFIMSLFNNSYIMKYVVDLFLSINPFPCKIIIIKKVGRTIRHDEMITHTPQCISTFM